ncbi:MAG: ArsR/SmtB family transcription factor [Nitrososphaerales archaeon]
MIDGDKKENAFDKTRAELFDALGHPARVKLLQALNQRALSFSDLKKEIGIESSGHLSFHLGKLSELVRSTPSGLYELTDDGKEALHLVKVMSNASPSDAAAEIQNLRTVRKVPFFRTQKRKAAVLISVIAITVLIIAGIWISSGYVIYGSQETMSSSNLNWSTSYPWHTIHFNDTKSSDLADFNFGLFNQPLASSTIVETVGLNLQIAHADGTFLDSLQLQISGTGPTYCCFLLEEVTSSGVGAGVPTSLSTINGITTFTVQHFGIIGVETVTLGLVLSLVNPINAANLPDGNNSIVMSVDLKMHSTSTVLIGHDYLGKSSATLDIMPNGQIVPANMTS